MGKELISWVNGQLKTKAWSMRELARRGKISPATVSKVLSGEENPGAKFYQGVARAFGVTLESVERLERDGTIPQSLLNDPAYRDLIELAQELTDEDLSDVLDYATYRLRRSKNLPL